jgi:hypothetical protein
MGKIGDLFVRLGLKSDGFKKGMKEAKKETQSFGSKLSSMKAGALAVWAAVGTAVVAFAKDFISSTNRIGDAWAKTMGGMKASWQAVKSSLSNWDWKGFGKKVSDAFKAGKEQVAAYDAEFELTNSVRLQKGAIQQELNELYAQMRDTSASNAARQAAAARYKALLQPIADAEIAVYGNMLDKAIAAWQAGTGLNRSKEEIIEYFTNIGTNAEAMMAKFPDIHNVYETMKGDATNLPIFDIIAKFQEASNQMSQVDKEMSRTTNSIKANIKRELEGIAAAVKEYGQEDLNLDLELDIDLSLDEAEIEAGMAEIDQYIQQFADNWNAKSLEIAEINKMLQASLVETFSSGLQALTDFVVGVDGASVEQVMAAFIQPIANTMKSLGELFLAEGIAELQLITGTPAQKIAAGAALVAIGSALSSGLAKMTSSLGGRGGTTASTGASATSAGGIETYEQEITVHVVGEISGNNIVLAGQKTLNKWNR